MGIFAELNKKHSKSKKKKNEYYFKTKKGQYGFGDVFVGISMPDIREIAKKFVDLKKTDLLKLITSKYHEYRMCGLIILVYRYQKSDEKNKKSIYNMYLKYKKYINNWDLVDVTTPNIVGEYIKRNKPEQKKIEKLANSNVMWNRRIAVLACFPQIKDGDFKMILQISKKLLKDKEDLMHKAVGWMLREVYKKDNKTLLDFINKNYMQIPRTTLRYAIEKIEDKKRKKILNRSGK